MDYKEKMKNALHKFKNIWKTGKIQRNTRITYGVIWNVILFFLIVGFIGSFFVGGIGAGYFASLVKDEKILDYETMAQDIYDYAETSTMYFANDVYFGEVNADIHRDETTLDQIEPLLLKAVIATEDEHFNEHKGVVPKAILRAVYQEVSSSATQTGGSTLTQQLIKNQILTNEVSFERKAKEILLALRLERFFDKDEILEAYLNIVPYGRDASGRNIAGVQTAAKGIFGINASEVNLAQAAYLAGLPQSPSAYTPFASGGGLKDEDGIQPGLNRMKTVLNRMYDMEYITKEQYDEALNYDLVADFKEEEESPFERYPILTAEIEERAQKILFDYFVKEGGHTAQDIKARPELKEEYQNMASRALRMNGYEIHSTIDKEIYDAFQEVAKNYQHYGPDTTTELSTAEGKIKIDQYVQAAGVMIENSTGRIISFLGSREYSLDDQLNYTVRARSPGSTIKPLLVYGPALEEGLIHPGTPIADVPYYVKDGGGSKEIRNVDLRHHGLMSATEHLAYSFNVPAVRTYLRMADQNLVEKYLNKMGVTTIGEDEYANASIALGGTSVGISLEEMANAFSTIANDGKFADAYLIEKITTKDGETIYEHKAEPVEVFSPQTSYLLIDMMRDVISKGTGTYLNSQLKYRNVDWAGKTGTSQNVENVHFFGSNPNVTVGTWLGYEQPDSLECKYCDLYHSNRNMKLWAELVNAASDINPELVAPPQAFQQPDGIVSRSYCALSGLLPSDLCQKAGLVKTGLFNAKFVPTERDNSLTTGTHVKVNGRSVVAGPDTPGEFTNGDGLMFTTEYMQKFGLDNLSNPALLLPANGDRSKWENIGIPSGSAGNSITNDNKAPTPPTSVKASGNKLTWNASGSNDVVGYRIYEAKEPGGSFSRVGSTTSTEYTIGKKNGVYYVKAVDYFGEESKESSTVIVGDTPKAEEKEKDEDKDTEETNKKETDDEKDDKAEEDSEDTESETESNSDSEDKDE
ncbi:penicillin-binding protein [Ralstonia pickettii]|nr:penicillin-binding protein [Ralstonia pickettii]